MYLLVLFFLTPFCVVVGLGSCGWPHVQWFGWRNSSSQNTRTYCKDRSKVRARSVCTGQNLEGARPRLPEGATEGTLGFLMMDILPARVAQQSGAQDSCQGLVPHTKVKTGTSLCLSLLEQPYYTRSWNGLMSDALARSLTEYSGREIHCSHSTLLAFLLGSCWPATAACVLELHVCGSGLEGVWVPPLCVVHATVLKLLMDWCGHLLPSVFSGWCLYL